MDGIFSILHNNLDGLKLQLKRLETISENIANAERVPDQNGKIYRRKIVSGGRNKKSSNGNFAQQMTMSLMTTNQKHLSGPSSMTGFHQVEENSQQDPEIRDVGKGKLIYDPTNPRADENGYLMVSDVNVIEEMVDMIAASRGYEANVTVMTAAKEMAKSTLKI
jgi:flagellar basal-body rod protein FlgC